MTGFNVCPRVRIMKKWIIVTVVMLVVLVNEWLSYTFTAVRWPSVPSTQGDSVRVLFAADPQILSFQSDSEPAFPLNLVTIWDADRFVSRGFHLALWWTRPDIVVFLGDLLNDGSIFNDSDFNSSLHHFRHLMHIPNYVKHTIFVPGDNDIGGEGLDQVTEHKIRRFFSFFNQTTTQQYKFVDFIQMRVMDDYDIATSTLPRKDGRIRVLLSHMPLLLKTKTTIKKKIMEQHPSFIFSGHDHGSFHYKGSKTEAHANEFHLLHEEHHVWEFEGAGAQLHEVLVPTCSYRMGKQATGYGLAVIEGSGKVLYTVLWLPSRFNQLWIYLTALGLILTILLFGFINPIKNFLFQYLRAHHYALTFLKVTFKYHRV
ncbi:hypothetical protein Pmani_028660 [Petrolisthes manimaculis]|uniref:Calcineurin-like phosphoesterase domain-containing protein n=1 Tax=Petrolisthes manimaculis TaxID=1843537 RepID=A0AAE1NZM0_9EUCA|nr:hypothetical protein Pmani_028660 [Petrolisthes manimaculis]